MSDGLKPRPMYMGIKFHDIDFGQEFLDAAKMVWGAAREKRYTTNHIDTLLAMQDEGVLAQTISAVTRSLVKQKYFLRLVSSVATNLAEKERGAEGFVREIKFTNFVWVCNYPLNDYISLSDGDVAFHYNNAFANEWHNGHIWLDLLSGAAGVF